MAKAKQIQIHPALKRKAVALLEGGWPVPKEPQQAQHAGFRA